MCTSAVFGGVQCTVTEYARITNCFAWLTAFALLLTT